MKILLLPRIYLYLFAYHLLAYPNIHSALRDPFVRADGKHSYAYTAFGIIHGTKVQFGLLNLDGLFYHVKQGDVIAGHTINELRESEIALQDPQGKEIRIFLQKKALQLR